MSNVDWLSLSQMHVIMRNDEPLCPLGPYIIEFPCEKFLDLPLKESLHGRLVALFMSSHLFFSFLSLKPKERKLKVRTGRQGKLKDQKGHQGKPRDLMVQQRTPEEAQRRTQVVQQRMQKIVLKQKARTSRKTRKRPRVAAVF